jgi:hypothetical protein
VVAFADHFKTASYEQQKNPIKKIRTKFTAPAQKSEWTVFVREHSLQRMLMPKKKLETVTLRCRTKHLVEKNGPREQKK